MPFPSGLESITKIDNYSVRTSRDLSLQLKKNMEINLISDTVTKPSPEMLQAMFNAKVGDDVFKQDPTVNEFERVVADLF